MNFDYGNVLARALQVTWKHKSILALALAPMLMSFLFMPLFAVPFFLMSGSDGFVFTDTAGTVLTTAFSIFFVLSLIFSYSLQTLSMSAATLGIVRAERNEGSLLFLDLVRDGIQYFWRILGTMLIIGLTIGMAFFVFFMLMFLLTLVTMGLASFCMQPIMILLTPLLFLMLGLMEGAQVAVVAEGLGAWDAVKRAVQVVRANVWKYVIITIVIYIASTILSTLMMAPLAASMFAFPVMFEMGAESTYGAMKAVSIAVMCIFMLVAAVIQGVVGTWMKVSLALTYLRLTKTTEDQVAFVEELT